MLYLTIRTQGKPRDLTVAERMEPTWSTEIRLETRRKVATKVQRNRERKGSHRSSIDKEKGKVATTVHRNKENFLSSTR